MIYLLILTIQKQQLKSKVICRIKYVNILILTENRLFILLIIKSLKIVFIHIKDISWNTSKLNC